jgi:hypothetical protein
MVITKSLTILGAGDTSTFIDASGVSGAGTIFDIHNLTSGAVTIDGFSIKTGLADTVASNGIIVYGLSGGATVTISNNTIEGNPSAAGTAKDNYSLYFYGSDESAVLVLDKNVVKGGGDNTILIERWLGPLSITGNTISRPAQDTSSSSAIYAMTYGGQAVTGRQLIDNNTFEMAGGVARNDVITFSPAYINPGGTSTTGS